MMIVAVLAAFWTFECHLLTQENFTKLKTIIVDTNLGGRIKRKGNNNNKSGRATNEITER